MPTEADTTLAAEFSQATEAEWLELVDKVLKGKPVSSLNSATPGGLTVLPLYTAHNSPDDQNHSGLPGQTPFTRGTQGLIDNDTEWAVRILVDSADPADSARIAVRGLERGATELLVRFDEAFRLGIAPSSPDFGSHAGVDGVLVSTSEDLAEALDGVLLDLAPVHLQAGSQFARAADLMITVWERRLGGADAVRGGIGADPLGHLAALGVLPQGIDAALAELGALAVRMSGSYPNVTAVSIDTSPYVEAGASEVQELALMLATGAAYLRAMAGVGMSADEACSQIEVSLSTDADVFTGIAKLRAARRLWSALTAACGASEEHQSVRLHVSTASRMMTRRDPWVNLLRVTAAAFAAGLGGAASVTTAPYDAALGQPEELARRLARNTQLLLLEESNLRRVTDPTGGSWYVESLTDEIVEAAWAQFQVLEQDGGLPGALIDGGVGSLIERVRKDRLDRVAKRLDPITGVSEFPNIHEEAETRAAPDLRALRSRAASGEASAGAYSVSSAETVCTPLVKVRWSEQFEALRDGSDSYKAATGSRPKVFLVNLGPVAVHTARSTFAKNFFEAGGIEATTSERGATVGFAEPAEAVADAMASGAHLVCICSSDEVYETHAEGFASALSSAGLAPVHLAGNPRDSRERLVAAGVDEFIYVGVNVLDVLQRAHDSIGTPSGTVRR